RPVSARGFPSGLEVCVCPEALVLSGEHVSELVRQQYRLADPHGTDIDVRVPIDPEIHPAPGNEALQFCGKRLIQGIVLETARDAAKRGHVMSHDHGLPLSPSGHSLLQEIERLL